MIIRMKKLIGLLIVSAFLLSGCTDYDLAMLAAFENELPSTSQTQIIHNALCAPFGGC